MKVKKLSSGARPATKMKIKKKRKMPKSSSSNPASKKFREAAKRSAFGGLFRGHGTPSASHSHQSHQAPLTLEALEKHNAATGGFTEASLQDDATSVGATTFNTWATNLTGCTNITFSRVHRYINSNSAVQKEILAVLAAVTEVIKEKGGDGKDVQYFAVLVSSLQEADKTDTKMAMAHLLSIVIKRVPVNIVQSRFSQVAKTLLDVITGCAKQEALAPLKPALSCLASLLRVQDVSKWAEPSTEHAFRAMLAFISHKKPKLRKAAHTAVKVVLRGSLFMQQTPAPAYHPAAPLTAQYCLKQIELSGGVSNKVDVLHILSLLKDVLSLFPHSSVKSICESVLRLMTLTDLVIRSSCMEVLYRLFSAKPSSNILPAQMNAQILTALYDYQPSEKDSQPMIAWLRVMEAATTNLALQERELSVSHLPRLFSTCMTCLLSDRLDVAKAAVSTMRVLLSECVNPTMMNPSNTSSSNQTLTALQKVVKTLETGLSYQFHSTWALVLQLWTTAFMVLGKVVPKMLMKVLTSMGDLRDTPHFSYKGEMEQAIGSAVKTMGPRLVLEAIPLGITGEDDRLDFPRGWLLPVIRDHVTHTELAFFTSYFLPLAAKFKKKAEDCAQEKRMAESKVYNALQLQVWSMLKGFCDHPTDLKQSFQSIAKSLGTALSENDDLRMDVMAALRSLITCSMDNDVDKAEVGRFSKNYLPILFNLFTSEGTLNEGARLAVLETIKKYLLVTDAQLVQTFVDKCLGKVGELDVTGFKNIALLDLVITMIPYADSKQLQQMFRLAMPRLQSEDRTIQKKSYRVLEEICAAETAGCCNLLTSNLDEIRDALLQSLSKSSPSSKAPRLRCLISVYKKLDHKNLPFLMATLPEAVLCTKEIGVKARAAAYQLIIVMSEAYIRWHQDVTDKDSLGEFVSKILAGLAGSPHMISASMLALTKIVHHYRDKLRGSILSNMIDSVCLLLTSKTREIVKTALGFIKVLISAYENTVLAAHLQDLLTSLHDIAVKGNMRRLTKIIYVKLIKKFGYELILNMTKEGVHKLLKNIHKSEERARRKHAAGGDSGEEDVDEDSEEEDKTTAQPESIDDLLRDTDSEMEDGEEDETRAKKGKKKKRQGKDAWLMETGDDEIVDFMDPAAAKQVLATRPRESKKEKKPGDKDRGFKMTADGRLIITQEEEDDKAKTAGGDADGEDDLEDLLSALGGQLRGKSRKRKREDVMSDEDQADENEHSTAKYKAGGSGIHRPVAQAKRSGKEQAVIGQEYKAKKAAGDVKKKGKPDPYAYVPLNIGNLNKRKQMKVKGSFQNLVKGARKGAAKGVKSKAVNRGKGGKGKAGGGKRSSMRL